MDKPQQYKLPDNTTNSFPLICKTFEQTEHRKWQIETLYEFPTKIIYRCQNIKRILNKLANENYLDIRKFLIHMLSKYPDSTVTADDPFYFAFSDIVLKEIGNKKVTLIPKPKDKSWKNNCIILPSLIYPDTYHWLERKSPMSTVWAEIDGERVSFKLRNLLEGINKNKLE